LLQGKPMTYQQLAAQAGCTVRSVRNYLNHAQSLFGFSIKKTRVPGSRVLLITADMPAPPPAHSPLRSLLGELLFHHLFPAHQHDDVPTGMAIIDGWPAYDPRHRLIADRWIAACQHDPWKPVRLHCSSAGNSLERVLWPVTTLLHVADGVSLIGVDVASQTSPSFVRVGLADILPDEDGVTPVEGDLLLPASTRRQWIELCSTAPVVRFGGEDDTIVNLHLRFLPPVVDDVRHRVWDTSQRVVFRRDGAMDLHIPRVPLSWAASLAASFGEGVEVLGSKKLRKAVKKRKFLP
jgi:hypothetical protein